MATSLFPIHLTKKRFFRYNAAAAEYSLIATAFAQEAKPWLHVLYLAGRGVGIQRVKLCLICIGEAIWKDQAYPLIAIVRSLLEVFRAKYAVTNEVLGICASLQLLGSKQKLLQDVRLLLHRRVILKF